MRSVVLLCCLALAASADERWLVFKSGPFEVFTDASARAGRETLVQFEEFRHALGQVVGEKDLQTPEPVRIILFRNAREAQAYPAPALVIEGRDRRAVLLTSGSSIPDTVFRSLTRLLLDSNTRRMPDHMERGLEDLLSTIQVTGIRITVGRPPASPNKDWARVHLLVVSPEYYGRLRVLLFNLRNGVDEGAAYRNAFGKTREAVEQEVERHLAAGNFQTTELSSRPMSERDFPEKPLESETVRLALADLMLGETSRQAYKDLIRDKAYSAEAHEGLGLLALRDGQREAARQEFAAAVEGDSQSARCYIEYARLESDQAKATAALEKATKLNPRLAEPYALMAARETDPARRVEYLRKAAERNPRELRYWQDLAEACLAAKDFAGAAKAWTAGEQAASTPADRDRMRKARLAIEQQRLDYEAAERKRVAEEQQRELERLKEQARAEVHALEARVNKNAPPSGQGEKPVPWWDGPKPQGRVRGILKRVECLGKQARLTVEDENQKLTRLLVTDPAQVTILGGGDTALSCGSQKDRPVIIEYFPKGHSKSATAGEVATIQFQ